MRKSETCILWECDAYMCENSTITAKNSMPVGWMLVEMNDRGKIRELAFCDMHSNVRWDKCNATQE